MIGYDMVDSNGDILWTYDSGGHADTIWMADITGDGKVEVVEYIQGVSLTIKSNGECDIDAKVTGEPQPQTKRQYNNTRYTAGETPV